MKHQRQLFRARSPVGGNAVLRSCSRFDLREPRLWAVTATYPIERPIRS
jgi:hypothetical protein